MKYVLLPEWTTEQDLAYVAGFLDADGCFCITKSVTKTFWGLTFCPRISGFSIDKHVLEYVQSILGGSIIIQRSKKHTSPLTHWRWTVNSERAYEAAKILYPYLRIKKNQAEVVIRYYSESTWLKKGNWKMPKDEFDRRSTLSTAINSLNNRDYLRQAIK